MRLNQDAIKLAQKNFERTEREALAVRKLTEKKKRWGHQLGALLFALLFSVFLVLLTIFTTKIIALLDLLNTSSVVCF